MYKNLFITYITCMLFPLSAAAQMAPRSSNGEYSHDAVTLARICVSEAGFAETDDCHAIYEVLAFRAEHIFNSSFEAAARRYSPSVFNLRPRRGRHWIPFLRGDLRRPQRWQRAIDWEGDYRERWKAVLDRAEAIVSGAVASPCQDVPQHWGCDSDLRINRWWPRIREGSWAITECGNVLNKFLHRVTQ
jgi:hypothetical protein